LLNKGRQSSNCVQKKREDRVPTLSKKREDSVPTLSKKSEDRVPTLCLPTSILFPFHKTFSFIFRFIEK